MDNIKGISLQCDRPSFHSSCVSHLTRCSENWGRYRQLRSPDTNWANRGHKVVITGMHWKDEMCLLVSYKHHGIQLGASYRREEHMLKVAPRLWDIDAASVLHHVVVGSSEM